MKAVVLLAGKGRRIEKLGLLHKALIKLDGESLVSYIIQNIERAGIDEIVPIIGHNGEAVLSEISRISTNSKIYPVWNDNYDRTNNLYSLYQAREILENEEFISINGDMVFDYRILKKIISIEGSSIAVDDIRCKLEIDSPGVVIKNNIVTDLGRHVETEDRGGYAIGIYKYGKEMVSDFFNLSSKMLEEDVNHGFHDPLRNLFNKYDIRSCSVGNYKWTDIDEEGDIDNALNILKIIKCSADV